MDRKGEVGPTDKGDVDAAKPRVRERVVAAGQIANERFGDARRRWPWLALPEELVRRWSSTNGSVLAGHLAYRVFVFILPLLVLLVGLLGYASASSSDVEGDITSSSGVGKALASTLADTGDQAKDGRLQLVVFGGLALLVAASGLVKALQLVFATAWGVSPKAGRSRLVVLGRFLPGVLVVLAAVALRQWMSRSGFVLSIGSEVLGIVIDAVALLGLSWVLPRRATRVIDLVPGAVLGGIGVGALHVAALVYFPNRIERASALYGTLGVALVVLLYLFLMGQILVVSALTNAVWLDRREIMAPPPPDV
jgi:uncharacterized BrkB/YihY/UPF0761 family membrane protein